MLWRAGVRANVNCISAGNSLLLERVVSQWTYDIKGKAGFKGSGVEDGPIADGAPGRIRTRDPLLRRQPLYPLSYWGIRIQSNHQLAGGQAEATGRGQPRFGRQTIFMYRSPPSSSSSIWASRFC